MIATVSIKATNFFSVLSILLVLRLIFSTLRFRHIAKLQLAEKYEAQAVHIFSELESAKAIFELLAPIYLNELSQLRPVARRGGENLQLIPMINSWTAAEARAKDDASEAITVQAAIDTAEKSVKVINEFAQLVDARLVDPREFLGARADLHLSLIETTLFLEPYIWHQAVVNGRGRWGMRVVELARILRRLSVEYRRPALRGEIRITTPSTNPNPFSALLMVEADFWHQIALRIRYSRLFYSAAITRRSKVRQNKIARLLAIKLGVASLPAEITAKW